MNKRLAGFAGLTGTVLLLAGCGGGGDSEPTQAAAQAAGPQQRALEVTAQQRAVAARKTATSSTNACAAVKPFYWEIGAISGKLASGTVDSSSSTVTYNGMTRVDLGSASKWIYGAYVVQRRGGVLNDMDRRLLTLNSGYNNLTACYPQQTVNGCFYYGDNELQDPAAIDKFSYNGGHLQKHAVNIGLGTMTRQAFATEVRTVLGEEIGITYDLAMPAGGATGTAVAYAAFLRKIMSGELLMLDLLGTSPVCTNPATCPTALSTPTPPNESWHYSLAHWVEDDPVVGDGSFSSPGTKGFYPWIDSNKKIYGLLVRQVDAGNGFASVDCGRLIRKAWKTGEAQQ